MKKCRGFVSKNRRLERHQYCPLEPSGEVTFKVDDTVLSTVTVSNSIARIDNWTIPDNWNKGTYTILANYTENNAYTNSSGTGNS